jgi:hypothetical protein
MELVKTDEAVAEKKKEVPAEDFTKQMTDGFAKAQGMADKINELMLGQWFTPMKLSSYSKRQMNQVDNDLRFIAQFFLLEQRQSLGVTSFRIISDAKERLGFIESNKQMLMQQIATFDLVAQMISELIPSEVK